MTMPDQGLGSGLKEAVHVGYPTDSDKTRSAQVFSKTVRAEFAFLKAAETLDDLLARRIDLSGYDGYLLPLCNLHVDDEQLIQQLALWREQNAFAYPSRFPVTVEGTKEWVRSRVLGVDDRLLFLVSDKHGRAIGHLGFANALNDDMAMEIDNVVRGIHHVHPGIMAQAMRALLQWASEVIGPRRVYLRVFSDNKRAIDFYLALGFLETNRIPLRKHIHDATVLYQPLEPDDREVPDAVFVVMDYAGPSAYDGSVILTAGPSISAREMSYATDAARYGWNRQWSGYIKRFEQTFADYLGVRHALSTSSCTGALHLALLTLGIGPGDEVLVPDITWVATANAVSYVGATPVFVDVQPQSWCLDPKQLESAVTPRTKAIIPVHLYGHPAEMDKIVEFATRHDLRVVEDAAPAIGAEFRGQKVGTFGSFAAFSFQGAKLLVTGEGGMLVTNDDSLYEQLLLLWDQGRDPNRTFWINQKGWKYKMSNLQAAVGLGQLERVDQLVEAKRRIFSWYAEGLHDIPGVALNHEMPWARSIYWMTSILLGEQVLMSREDLRAQLRAMNVDTRPVFPAISQYPIWQRIQSTQPRAKWIGDRAINLPSGVCLTRAQVNHVCNSITSILG